MVSSICYSILEILSEVSKAACALGRLCAWKACGGSRLHSHFEFHLLHCTVESSNLSTLYDWSSCLWSIAAGTFNAPKHITKLLQGCMLRYQTWERKVTMAAWEYLHEALECHHKFRASFGNESGFHNHKARVSRRNEDAWKYSRVVVWWGPRSKMCFSNLWFLPLVR